MKLLDICHPRNHKFFQLAQGSHNSPDNGMCAMEFVAYLAGERHSDHPECTCPVIGAFTREYNDACEDADRQQLLSVLPHLVGTRGPREIELQRVFRCADMAVRTWAPRTLESAGLRQQAEALRGLPPIRDATSARAASSAACWAACWAADSAHSAEGSAHSAEGSAHSAAHSATRAKIPVDEVIEFLKELADMHREAPLEFRAAPHFSCVSLEAALEKVQ